MASNTQTFSPDSVVELAANDLRREGGDQPSLKNPYEAIALIGHACMVAVGFRLVGLGEDHNLGLPISLHTLTVHFVNLFSSEHRIPGKLVLAGRMEY